MVRRHLRKQYVNEVRRVCHEWGPPAICFGERNGITLSSPAGRALDGSPVAPTTHPDRALPEETPPLPPARQIPQIVRRTLFAHRHRTVTTLI